MTSKECINIIECYLQGGPFQDMDHQRTGYGSAPPNDKDSTSATPKVCQSQNLPKENICLKIKSADQKVCQSDPQLRKAKSEEAKVCYGSTDVKDQQMIFNRCCSTEVISVTVVRLIADVRSLLGR
ncbi:hypothetical protein Hdeb2414_s0188g00827441 [Helianthus debilis subsp. tardiflorus]